MWWNDVSGTYAYRQKGKIYDMAGILPIDCTIEHPSLNLGYREMKYKGVLLRGHEFHFP